ncbi:MAG: hypothetical protein HC875_41625 [Anaerolineales bacterium]|nr:hypothetical protein [Anaerolineales bacterium]
MTDETTRIGNINFSGISDSQVKLGDIIVDIKAGGDIVVQDKIIQNITQIQERALTAAEEAQQAHLIVEQRLAEGVKEYAQRLAATAASDTDADAGGPYKGLLAYRLSDAELFYGRDQAITRLLRVIHSHTLTILHSESGAGKSSLLQAGIQPYLLADTKPHLPVYIRPYNVLPSVAIKKAFLPDIAEVKELAEAPLQYFLRQVTRVLGAGATLYLLLDQFEEVFTALSEANRTLFVKDLAACLNDSTLRVRWVLALRSEFFSDLANFRPIIENPFENEYRLNRLTITEAASVITDPAARHNLTFEPALIQTLLQELKNETGEYNPPQIQLVCLALYNLLLERQKDNPALPAQITQAMYEEAGRAEGILQGHLKRVLSQNLSTKHERDLARQVLVSLVSSDNRRIRRTRSNLARELGNYIVTSGTGDDILKQIDPLLGQLIKSRLLNVEKDEVTGEPGYELAHDYLLADLEIDPELQTRKAAQEMLDQAVKIYTEFNDALLSEDQFNVINSQRQFLVLDETAEKLLHLSQIRIEAEIQAKEARRREELERQRAIGEEQRRRAEEQEQATLRQRKWTKIAVVFGSAAVIALLVTIFLFLVI